MPTSCKKLTASAESTPSLCAASFALPFCSFLPASLSLPLTCALASGRDVARLLASSTTKLYRKSQYLHHPGRAEWPSMAFLIEGEHSANSGMTSQLYQQLPFLPSQDRESGLQEWYQQQDSKGHCRAMQMILPLIGSPISFGLSGADTLPRQHLTRT